MKPLDCLELYRDASFYDLEFGAREHEIPFYVERATEARGRVLEVGCGTGRLTLPIARHGIEIVGVDASSEMLDRAEEASTAEGLSVEWILADCREMELEGRFDLVFLATNTIQHLLDNESVLACLRRARDLLTPSGKLILEAYNPDPEKLSRRSEESYQQKRFTDKDGREILVEASSCYDRASQILGFDLDYLREGEAKPFLTKKVSMRCFFPQELAGHCQQAGLEVEERLGDHDGAPFTSSSAQQILVCRAAEALLE